MQKTDVSCAIILRNGMVLVTKRDEEVSNSSLWEFPGGKPHKGEDARDCVVRRIKEELNIDIEITDHIEPYDTESDGREFRIHPFVAKIIGGKMVLSLHSRAEWFKPMQLLSLAWPETDLPIIEEILSRILQKGSI